MKTSNPKSARPRTRRVAVRVCFFSVETDESLAEVDLPQPAFQALKRLAARYGITIGQLFVISVDEQLRRLSG